MARICFCIFCTGGCIFPITKKIGTAMPHKTIRGMENVISPKNVATSFLKWAPQQPVSRVIFLSILYQLGNPALLAFFRVFIQEFYKKVYLLFLKLDRLSFIFLIRMILKIIAVDKYIG